VTNFLDHPFIPKDLNNE